MSAGGEEQEKTTIEQQQKMTMKKVIACKITEEEFQKTILPTMYDCYDLGIIDPDGIGVCKVLHQLLDRPLQDQEATV
jgi:hypothetical protein